MLFIVLAKFLVFLTLCEATGARPCKKYERRKRVCSAQSLIAVEMMQEIIEINSFEQNMTMKQIKNTGKMMRKTCQPKNNVADEKIDVLNDGVFIEEKEVMCYMACIMKMANAMKNGKLNYEAAMKQADLLLPEDIKEPTKAAMTACRKVPDGYKDICEASFHTTKCMYDQNPDIFYFP